MARYVPDILTHRWVVISPQRLHRSIDEVVKRSSRTHKGTIFCEGNEHLTPPEVLRYGDGEANKPGWKVRVIPNKYPITDYHEIIIHSPDPVRDIEKLPLPQVKLILRAYRERYNFYREKGQVLIFCNHGLHAGASIDHPHSQLVVLPFQINLDTVTREPLNNIVETKKYLSAYCPDFSQWPYEMWIVPNNEQTVFGEITDDELEELAGMMHRALKRLEEIYPKYRMSDLPMGYNFYIYPKKNWYMRLIPRLVHRAGFELGTGLSVNVVDPADAAEAYRGHM